jgi:tRNA U34 5-carboxymethylaminomethyl modifying GTPase MnmE/TrmE
MARKKRKAAASKKTTQELRTLRQRLDALLGRAKRTERQIEARYAKQMQVLRAKQAQAKTAAQKLRRRSAAAAPPLKAGLQRAWADLNDAVRQAAAIFRKTS